MVFFQYVSWVFCHAKSFFSGLVDNVFGVSKNPEDLEYDEFKVSEVREKMKFGANMLFEMTFMGWKAEVLEG